MTIHAIRNRLLKLAPERFHPAIVDILLEMENIKLKVKLGRGAYLRIDGVRCAGYFDEVSNTLAVTPNVAFDSWFQTFLHEYCHSLQYHYEREHWKTFDKPSRRAFDWLAGEIELTPIQAHDACMSVAQLELECEQKVVQLARCYEFTDYLKQQKYIQKSNAYINFHHHMAIDRTWYNPVAAPYMAEILYNEFPDDHLVLKKRLSKKVLGIYRDLHKATSKRIK